MMQAILVFIVVLIFLQGGALIYLVVQKRKRANREHARRDWQLAFRDDIYDYATSERQDMPTIQKGNEDLAELELFALSNLTATPEHLERIQAFVASNMQAYYEQQLKHRRIDRRLNAYEAVSQFRLVAVAPMIHARWGNTIEKEESDVIVRTLVSLSPQDAIAIAKQENGISFFGAILAVGRSQDLEEWVAAFEELTLSFKLAILQLIFDRDETRYIALVRDKTTDENPEIRKRALRALTRIGLEEDWKLYVPYLEEESSWVEQMLALRFLEHVVPADAIPAILPFVGSRSWWVRTAAFDALLACGGIEQLAKVSSTHPDRYARQKATERLAKEMKHHVV